MGCSGDPKPSAACTVTLSPSADDQTTIQSALTAAKSGDSVCLARGRFHLTDQLSLSKPEVALRGSDTTVLDFSGASGANTANALEILANDDVVDTVQIENPLGDGVRATQVDGVTFRNIKVVWTGGPSANNGGYGIYPVSSSKVLVEHCFVSGASDTGIYVGQSNTIVIRDNETTGNVAGIEIENSTDAEVYGNDSHHNAAGILVFNLPGLPVKDGNRANVHDNQVRSNNLQNFAPSGNIVAQVPTGTGMLVLASDDNELHANTVTDNESTGIAIVSWFILGRDSEGKADPGFDWYPEGNFVHDNQLAENGASPQGLAATLAKAYGLTKVPDLVWDGYVDWAKVYGDSDGGTGATRNLAAIPTSLRNCFANNGNATFIDLDLPDLGANSSTSLEPYTCEHPALPHVQLCGERR